MNRVRGVNHNIACLKYCFTSVIDRLGADIIFL